MQRCSSLTSRTTDTQRGFFFSKILNFWAWADKLGWNFLRHLGYFRPNYQHYFGTASPLSMGKCIWFFFLQKTLVFRSKTYNSQITPKYDIGRKEFGKDPSHFHLWCLFKKIRFLFHRIIHSVNRTSRRNSVVILVYYLSSLWFFIW